MKLKKPSYYDTFCCIAARCSDSCCKEWDVQVDAATAAAYRTLPGPLGDRLRQVLKEENGETVMTNIDNRCPMWRQDGLCQIQAELGEAALCKTCREFPRLTHDYGSFVEQGLELSCPEAARIILGCSSPSFITEEIPGGDAPGYDTEAMEVLLRSRTRLHAILSDTSHPANEILAAALLYGYQAQNELDGAPETPFDTAAALDTARQFAIPADPDAILDFFRKLEILTPDWKRALLSPTPACWERTHLLLARYFADRYWLQAVSDYDLVSRVKLIIISCLVIRSVGGDLLRCSQLYSKEIENNIDNIEAILDSVYEDPAFADNRLLGLLLL